jgi:hypothetical protein
VAPDGTTVTHAIVVTVANSGPPVPVPWEDDPFENLVPGPLAGQSGWIATGASPVVSAGSLLIDPLAGQTIQVGKDVVDQTAGRHRVTLRVQATTPGGASMAKLEIQSDPATGWDKLCQVFVGSHVRVNYDPNGAAAVVVPATVSGQWYALTLDIDLNNHRLDVYVDNVLVAPQLPIRTGPLTRLSISGWDLAGAVRFDDLRGIQLVT